MSAPSTHTKDSDCTIDPATDACSVCGVDHSEECPDCGKRAFHSPGCWLVQNGNTHTTEQEGTTE